MIEIDFSSSFKKAFKQLLRKNKALERKYWKRVEIFIENPYHPILKCHKLSGELKELWSFSVAYDCRVIFYFETASKVVFIDIGKHDVVY
jgi:mRNA-degrading endonuclease YafQ of YafQ-DinJ toxin-antitoxin module